MKRLSSDGKLLIIGAGQYGMVAKETAEAMGCFDRIDFLDDNNPIAIGKISEYESLINEYKQAIVAIGNSKFRLELTNKLVTVGYKIATIISPMSCVSKSARLAHGCIVEAMAVVNTEAEIGECCFISAGAVVNHNSVIGDGCHIDCNATVKSNSAIKSCTKVEYGQVTSSN